MIDGFDGVRLRRKLVVYAWAEYGRVASGLDWGAKGNRRFGACLEMLSSIAGDSSCDIEDCG